MKDGRASRTAEFAAGFRALESARRPARDRLFTDPFAAQFLRPSLRRLVALSGWPVFGPLVRGTVERGWPGAMTSGIARTRLIDDWLRDALGRGVDQLLVLGAGFDSRAYRIDALKTRRVVEIDHPDTQAVKRRVIEGMLGTLPHHVTLHGADLGACELGAVLRETPLDWARPVFVIWEGVIAYLSAAAVESTLRALSKAMAPGGLAVLTYIHRGLIDGSRSFDGAGLSQNRVSSEGEPWVFGFDPDCLAQDLSPWGWRLIEDIGADDYRARYWGERGRRMRGFSFYRCALAEPVGPT